MVKYKIKKTTEKFNGTISWFFKRSLKLILSKWTDQGGKERTHKLPT